MKVILGTSTFGTAGPRPKVQDPEKLLAILEKFRSKGFNELDTARVYGGGSTEGLLGSLKVQQPPLSFTLATKANPGGSSGGLSYERLREQFSTSLNDLGTNHVDIFYLHSPDHITPIEETLKAVNELHKEGKFDEFGLSNFASWQVTEVYYICKANNYVLPTVYQGRYNAITRKVESELFPALKKFGIRFYAFNPLAGGFLTGKYSFDDENANGSSRFQSGTPQGATYRSRYWNKVYFDAIEHIRAACNDANISLIDASLRWFRHYSKLDFERGDGLIIGVSSITQLEHNLNVLVETEKLPAAVAEAFDQAWEKTKGVSPTYFRKQP